MRWLRCVLSREFKIEYTLMYWDFIFGGIESKHKSDPKSKTNEFLPIDDDPLANLDYLCVAMIISIKAELLESDFSMCLAQLLNFPEPNVPESLMKYALKIKEKMKEPQHFNSNDIFENARQKNHLQQ
jgi:hypothetical protein